MPERKEELPSTLRRSPRKAQETYRKTLYSAHEQYDNEERAHRAAFAALKRGFEKVGDHWEPKDGKGPSDAQAAKGGPEARDRPAETAGGVDANASKEHLYQLAQRLDIPRRSQMTKKELVVAIKKANQRQTARARQ